MGLESNYAPEIGKWFNQSYIGASVRGDNNLPLIHYTTNTRPYEVGVEIATITRHTD